MTFALIVVGGYLLGSCPWGYWLVLLFRHEDVRRHGSAEGALRLPRRLKSPGERDTPRERARRGAGVGRGATDLRPGIGLQETV